MSTFALWILQRWQLYHDNWISGYQFVEDELQEQALVITIEDTIYTFVTSRNSGRYALDDLLSGSTP